MKNKKNSLMIILFILLILLSICLYMDYQKIPVKLKQDIFTLEYGENISSEIENYFNITDTNKFNKTESEFQLSIPSNINEVGVWNCSLHWRNQKIPFSIEIKDTQNPQIVLNQDKISIDYGTIYDIKSNIKSVTDPVDGILEYKIEGTINNKKAGNYHIKIIASDKNGNISNKEFTVTVNEKIVKENTNTNKNSNSSNKTTSVSTAKYPIIYEDSTSKITITKEWYKKAWCYIAHIEFTDYDRFKTQCGNNKYGSKETIKHAANRTGAILAINGCYSSPNLNYPVVRSGKIKNGSSKTLWCPAVYSSNNGLLLSAWESGGTKGIAGEKLSSLVKSGLVTDTFCFGPPILSNGKIISNKDTSRAQRTFIGTNGKPGDIWLVVSDGRKIDSVSSGLRYIECAQLLKNKGCTFGVPLDGGGSSTMVFKGKVLNKATNRAVVDFVYFK